MLREPHLDALPRTVELVRGGDGRAELVYVDQRRLPVRLVFSRTGSWRAVVEACVPALVEAWEPIMGVKAGKLAYRNMTSRWGSCQPATGRICINVRLALYPPECLEYVVVHELCHLLERGHGPRFKERMDAFMPDWRERRAKLR